MIGNSWDPITNFHTLPGDKDALQKQFGRLLYQGMANRLNYRAIVRSAEMTKPAIKVEAAMIDTGWLDREDIDADAPAF